MKFPINKELLSSAKGARGKSVADLEHRKLWEKEEHKKRKRWKRKKEEEEKRESLSKLEIELRNHYRQLRVAGERIKMENQKSKELCLRSLYPGRNFKVHKLWLIWDWSENIS